MLDPISFRKYAVQSTIVFSRSSSTRGGRCRDRRGSLEIHRRQMLATGAERPRVRRFGSDLHRSLWSKDQPPHHSASRECNGAQHRHPRICDCSDLAPSSSSCGRTVGRDGRSYLDWVCGVAPRIGVRVDPPRTRSALRLHLVWLLLRFHRNFDVCVGGATPRAGSIGSVESFTITEPGGHTKTAEDR